MRERVLELFRAMVQADASDMFLRINSLPRLRVHRKIQPLGTSIVSKDEIFGIANYLLATEDVKKKYVQNLDVDFVFHETDVGRFRINIFTQRGTPAIVARHVKTQVQDFAGLNLPVDLLKKFCDESSGLVLVSGPAGSGKSTTIASMIEYINDHYAKHIVTIEDPIEYLFKDKNCIINQRELGMDVHSYPSALKHVTQQSPDIIFIGNTRDVDTMSAAMHATELGTFVLTTFHTINAVQTIIRIVNFFPPHLHDEVRMQLSLILKGVVSLRLLPRKDGKGLIPAFETMIVTPTIGRLIREANTKEIQRFIDEGEFFGMQSFRKSLVRLVKQDLVDEQEARKFADSRDEFDLEMKGVKRLNE